MAGEIAIFQIENPSGERKYSSAKFYESGLMILDFKVFPGISKLKNIVGRATNRGTKKKQVT